MIKSTLLDYLSDNDVKCKSPVNTAELVTFKVGGVGSLAVFPQSIQQLCDIISIVKDDRYVVLGNGSNCYFTHNYFDGIIIVTSGINKTTAYDNVIYAECGATVNSVCKLALKNRLTGMEFAFGIPGTIGGAITMNASAFSGCFADIVIKSTAFDIYSGETVELNNEEHRFDTKKSIFQRGRMCLLSTCITLNQGEENKIREKMNELFKRRALSQPLDMPSAGSTFIKPEGYYASRLIDLAGLKGFTVGGAQVSTKHAGFIVNLGNATATDVHKLIEYVKKAVYKKFNVELNEEIIYLE